MGTSKVAGAVVNVTPADANAASRTNASGRVERPLATPLKKSLHKMEFEKRLFGNQRCLYFVQKKGHSKLQIHCFTYTENEGKLLQKYVFLVGAVNWLLCAVLLYHKDCRLQIVK